MERDWRLTDQLEGLIATAKTNNCDESATKVLDQLKDQLALMYKISHHPSPALRERNPIIAVDTLPEGVKVACQGVEGAYSHIAAKRLFSRGEREFYTEFEDVTRAVATGKARLGLLPIENSTAGMVDSITELVCNYGCYINTALRLEVQHCLCGTSGTTKKTIREVYSHPQALKQAAVYIKTAGYAPINASNTAAAARYIAEQRDSTKACICSRLSAEIYGLEIIEESVQDQSENYTRFICIANEALVLKDASIVSIALSFHNEQGALNRLLTLFSLFSLDLTKIQSMPIGGADFSVRFHLDFKGKISSPAVENLLGHMYDVYDDFQFLGNYPSY